MKAVGIMITLGAFCLAWPQAQAASNTPSPQEQSAQEILGKRIPDLYKAKLVSQLSPEQIVFYLKAEGVDVLRFDDPQNTVHKGTFSFVKKASKELISLANLEPDDEGLHLTADDPCCSLKNETILIETNAPVMSLIHEYMHELFRRADLNPKLRKAYVSSETENAARRAEFYVKKFISGSVDVGDERWRRDLNSAIEDLNQAMPAITGLFVEEALIEGLMLDVVPRGARYFDEERHKKGMAYGEYSLKNLENKILIMDHLVFWYKDALSVEPDFEGKKELEQTLANYQSKIIQGHYANLETARKWLNEKIAAKDQW